MTTTARKTFKQQVRAFSGVHQIQPATTVNSYSLVIRGKKLRKTNTGSVIYTAAAKALSATPAVFDLSSLKPIGPLSKAEVQERIAHGRVAEIKE